MSERLPILGANKPGQSIGPERFDAQCEGCLEQCAGCEERCSCDRSWHAEGSINSRQAFARAQKHADRLGHRISAEWANRR